NYGPNMSRFELAHFAVQNYGNVRDGGGGLISLGDAHGAYLHDIEMTHMLENTPWGPCGGTGENILISLFKQGGGSPYAFENILCTHCGGFHFRGAISGQGLRIKNYQSLDYPGDLTAGCRGVI